MKDLYVLRGSDGEIYIDGPFTEAELEARFQKDYEGCTPPKFADRMPTGSLMYMGENLIVFRAEVVVPAPAEVVRRWRVPPAGEVR